MINKKDDENKQVCIICKEMLLTENTKIGLNKKYLRYRNIVCMKCFNIYYPESD